MDSATKEPSPPIATVPADLIVLAIGCHAQFELVRRVLGEAVVDRIGPV